MTGGAHTDAGFLPTPAASSVVVEAFGPRRPFVIHAPPPKRTISQKPDSTCRGLSSENDAGWLVELGKGEKVDGWTLEKRGPYAAEPNLVISVFLGFNKETQPNFAVRYIRLRWFSPHSFCSRGFCSSTDSHQFFWGLGLNYDPAGPKRIWSMPIGLITIGI